MPPGSMMTYDSEDFIQHISYTLTAVAQSVLKMEGALEYASARACIVGDGSIWLDGLTNMSTQVG